MIKRKLKIALPLGLGLFLCFYAYQKFTPEQLNELQSQFKRVDYTYFWLSVGLGMLSHISRGFRWQYTLSPLGYFPKKINLIIAVFISYLMNLTLPRSGEVSRAVVLKRYENIPFDKSFGTIVTERIIDMLVLMLFIIITFFTQFDLLQKFVLDKISATKIIYILSIFFLCGIIGIIWLYKSKSKFAYRLKHLFIGFKSGILSVFQMEHKWKFMFHTIFIWAMYFLMFYIIFFSLAETSDISLSDALMAFVVGSFAVIFTNGGFGAYPLFIAEILVSFGIAYTVGTTIGWVLWLSQFVMILFFGSLSFILLPFFNKK